MILAIGQENAFPWIERDIGIEFDKWDMPVVDKRTMQSHAPGVFFGGDAAFGPKNIIWAVAHGHQAAISIHNHCQGVPLTERPDQGMNLISQKMGIHEWSYSNDYNPAKRAEDAARRSRRALQAAQHRGRARVHGRADGREVQRCLNCDMQTVFTDRAVHRVRRLHRHLPGAMPDHRPERRGAGAARSGSRRPPRTLKQDIFVSGPLPQTGRVMVKDEDLCVHCGLCAERCPTAAWDMQKFELLIPYAGQSPCSSPPK